MRCVCKAPGLAPEQRELPTEVGCDYHPRLLLHFGLISSILWGSDFQPFLSHGTQTTKLLQHSRKYVFLPI